ncbi:RGS domain-containing protein [Camillea tinctor]|nr:RGS domain-containing protein [Camillea tinctor]
MGRSRLRGSSPVYLTPSPRELSPSSSSSIRDDWDAETAMETSRPTSLAIPRTASPFFNPPSLADILSDTAPQPWTLSAFMAFLSQNHCLETLEFILDAERYRTAYLQASQGQLYLGPEHICELWQKIIEAYIMPCAPREVNLPSDVRDRLLTLPYSTSEPTDPSELDEAVQIVRDLMNDSVLVPFLESVVSAAAAELNVEDSTHESRQGRSRLRVPRELGPEEETSQSPRTSLLPLFGKGRGSSGALHRSTSSLTESPEVDLTDDSNSPGSTSGAEPMTPPTTPPTSDFTFGSSPKSLQRAISGNSWKKVGAKLGLGKKSKSIRRSNQAVAPSSHPGAPSFTSVDQSSHPPL